MQQSSCFCTGIFYWSNEKLTFFTNNYWEIFIENTRQNKNLFSVLNGLMNFTCCALK